MSETPDLFFVFATGPEPVDGVQWLVTHKEHNRLMHAMIGNIDNGHWADYYTHERLLDDLASPISGDASVPFWRPGRLIVASDASLENGSGSFGLVPVGHICSGGAILHPMVIPHSMYAEVVGISSAFDLIKAIFAQFPDYREAYVLRDSSSAIRAILGLDSTPTADRQLALVVQETRHKLDQLMDILPVTLRWIKGHSGILVNERADEIADFYVRRVLAAKKLWHEVAAQDTVVYQAALRQAVIDVIDDEPLPATSLTQSAAISNVQHSELISRLEHHVAPINEDDNRELADRLLAKTNLLPPPGQEAQQATRSALATLRLPLDEHNSDDILDIRLLARHVGLDIPDFPTGSDVPATIPDDIEHPAPKRIRIVDPDGTGSRASASSHSPLISGSVHATEWHLRSRRIIRPVRRSGTPR